MADLSASSGPNIPGPFEHDETVIVDVAQSPSGQALRMFLRNRAAVLGAVLLLAILFVTFVLPLFVGADRLARVGGIHEPPFGDGPWLGTDNLGRNVAVITMHGGVTTLKVAGMAVVFIIALGGTVGAVAGYYGGWVDSALMRFTEFFQILPGLLFATVVVALFEPSTLIIVIAIGAVTWPGIARLMRAEFLRLRNLEFVKAARAIGASDLRIMTRVILPNTLPTIIVYSTLLMGTAILFEAGLAFLGLGDPQNYSWGYYVGLNRQFFLSNWWGVTVPGLMIFGTVLSLSLIGDGLQDALNPRLRGR